MPPILTPTSSGGGGGAVDSVNGEIGVVVLDTDDVGAGATNKYATAAEKVKVGHLTVTQAVDLDAIETRVNSLDAAVVLRGSWDASAGTFPGGGTAQAGDSYIVSVAGTVGGVAFGINDRAIAITDNASTTVFASNWFKADYTDQVLSVDGRTGAVTLSDLYQPVDADLTDIAAIADVQGDILIRGAAGWERLGKGTASQVLRINAGATAPEWATPNMVPIAQLSGAAASYDFQNIPATFETLVIDIIARSDAVAAAVNVRARFNNDAGANYDHAPIFNDTATTVKADAEAAQTGMYVAAIAAASATAGRPGVGQVRIPGYARTVFNKIALSQSLWMSGTTAASMQNALRAGLWRSTDAIDRITLTPSSGSFIAGSVATLYGIRGN